MSIPTLPDKFRLIGHTDSNGNPSNVKLTKAEIKEMRRPKLLKNRLKLKLITSYFCNKLTRYTLALLMEKTIAIPAATHVAIVHVTDLP